MKSLTKKRSTPKNTAVYVTGLPEDITFDEVSDHFSKCGIIMDEVSTGRPRVKLYTQDGDEEKLKGDALVVYLREESVKLALTILDESEIRPAIRIRVQEASFNDNGGGGTEEKSSAIGDNGDSTSKRHKIDKEIWKRHMRQMNKKLEWFDEEGEAEAREAARLARFAKIAVLRHMYALEELQSDPLEFPLQLSEEIIEECKEKLGFGEGCTVQVIEDFAADGVCTVKFKTAQEALLVIKLMNGRWFAGQRVEASIYDGSFPLPKKNLKTTSLGDEDRLEEFSAWLEQEHSDEVDSEDDHDDQNSNSSDSDSASVSE